MYSQFMMHGQKNIKKHSECVILLFFSAATLVTRRRLNITLHVHCLSSYLTAAIISPHNVK